MVITCLRRQLNNHGYTVLLLPYSLKIVDDSIHMVQVIFTELIAYIIIVTIFYDMFINFLIFCRESIYKQTNSILFIYILLAISVWIWLTICTIDHNIVSCKMPISYFHWTLVTNIYIIIYEELRYNASQTNHHLNLHTTYTIRLLYHYTNQYLHQLIWDYT